MSKRIIAMLLSFMFLSIIWVEPANATSFGTTPSASAKITSNNGLIWLTKEKGTYNWYWNGSSWISGNTSIGGTYPNYRGPYDHIRDIFIDSQGRLWFSGAYDSDDNLHVTGYFQMNIPGKDVSHFLYERFVKDKNGNIWGYGYSEGDYYRYPYVGYFNGNGFTNLPVPAPFRLTSQALTIDQNGTAWICGEGNRVSYWNGSSWVSNNPPFSGGLNIRVLAAAGDGSIIAIGYHNYGSGWAVYKNGVWTIKQQANDQHSAAPISTSCVETGPDGKVWGISLSDTKRLAYYENGVWGTTVPAPFYIEDFTVDDSGIVWAIDAISSNKVAAYIEGSWFTDTDSFSAKLIEAAKKSADKAALNATNAMNAANNAATYASWANSNAEAAKNNILWGTDNGGKSLGATYDKAGAAANDAGYIRMPQG